MDEVRRNRQSIADGLKESGDAMKASTDRLAAIQMAMDAVKSLNNKELFNKLPRHRQVGGSPWVTVGHRGPPWVTVGHRGPPWATVGHRG